MLIKTERKFESAHRQFGDTSKCGKLHGHNWLVEIEVEGTPGVLGYIVDFKKLCDIVDRLDHKVLLQEDDPLVLVLREYSQEVVTFKVNPTCENLAYYFLESFAELLNNERSRWQVIYVAVYENDISNAMENLHNPDFINDRLEDFE